MPLRTLAGWQSWTATIAQGATSNIAKNKLYDKWKVSEDGEWIDWIFRYQITGAGTAGATITVSSPFTLPSLEGATTGSGYGYGAYFRQTATIHVFQCAVFYSSSTAVRFFTDNAGAATALGVNPSFATANLDTIQANLHSPRFLG
jgi:hypothetical protein